MCVCVCVCVCESVCVYVCEESKGAELVWRKIINENHKKLRSVAADKTYLVQSIPVVSVILQGMTMFKDTFASVFV